MEPSEGSRPLQKVEAIVRAAQRGDPLAFDGLMRALMRKLGPICGAIALDQGDDALQEAMIAILRNIRSLRDPQALLPWARRIAVREAIRLARAKPDSVGVGVDAPSRVPDPAVVVDVRDTLQALAPEQRAILVLRDLVGLSETEAAQVLAIAPGTVKSRLHRARAAFRRRWKA